MRPPHPHPECRFLPPPLLALALCLGCCLLHAAPALAMGPRPDALPRFQGDTHQTIYEAYSTAEKGRLQAYTLVAQFAGCPDQARFSLKVDADQDAVMLPGVEQLDRDETCLRLSDIRRGRDTALLRGVLGGCDQAGLTATVPIDCPDGCTPPEIELEHDCAYAEAWVAGQPGIMDSHPGPRGLGWMDGPRHTLAGFHFSDLRPGPLQIVFSRKQDRELEVIAVHFVSDPEAEHTARVESLGAQNNVYSAMVHAPGEYELLILLSGGEDLEQVDGRVIPATPLRPVELETDYAAATLSRNAVLGEDGWFEFAVDNCAGQWSRRHGLCPPRPQDLPAAENPPALPKPESGQPPHPDAAPKATLLDASELTPLPHLPNPTSQGVRP
jgi:hypothetical protein